MKGKRANLLGKVFSWVTVIEPAGSDSFYNSLFKCKCDCDKIFVAQGRNLRDGKTKSCGCKRRHLMREAHWEGVGELGKEYWGAVVRGAKKRKLEVSLTIEQAWEQFERQNRLCALSGETLSFQTSSAVHDGTASLDRIDSSKGYVSGNVQWVHKTVNNMKQALPEQEFVGWCKKIANNN